MGRLPKCQHFERPVKQSVDQFVDHLVTEVVCIVDPFVSQKLLRMGLGDENIKKAHDDASHYLFLQADVLKLC